MMKDLRKIIGDNETFENVVYNQNKNIEPNTNFSDEVPF